MPDSDDDGEDHDNLVVVVCGVDGGWNYDNDDDGDEDDFKDNDDDGDGDENDFKDNDADGDCSPSSPMNLSKLFS